MHILGRKRKLNPIEVDGLEVENKKRKVGSVRFFQFQISVQGRRG